MALPEYLQYRGPDDGFRASARPIPGPHTDAFAAVARRRDAWILIGSTAEASGDPLRPHNTSTLIAPDGSIAATYRKIHLFDVSVDAGPVDTESDRVTAGRARRGRGRGRRLDRPVDLLRPALPRAVPGPGPCRGEGPDRPGQLHGTDRPGPLGGPAPGPGDRERGVRAGPVADRRARSIPRHSGDRWSSTRGGRSSPRRRTPSGSSMPRWTSTGWTRSAARSRPSPTVGRTRTGSSAYWSGASPGNSIVNAAPTPGLGRLQAQVAAHRAAQLARHVQAQAAALVRAVVLAADEPAEEHGPIRLGDAGPMVGDRQPERGGGDVHDDRGRPPTGRRT